MLTMILRFTTVAIPNTLEHSTKEVEIVLALEKGVGRLTRLRSGLVALIFLQFAFARDDLHIERP